MAMVIHQYVSRTCPELDRSHVVHSYNFEFHDLVTDRTNTPGAPMVSAVALAMASRANVDQVISWILQILSLRSMHQAHDLEFTDLDASNCCCNRSVQIARYLTRLADPCCFLSSRPVG